MSLPSGAAWKISLANFVVAVCTMAPHYGMKEVEFIFGIALAPDCLDARSGGRTASSPTIQLPLRLSWREKHLCTTYVVVEDKLRLEADLLLHGLYGCSPVNAPSGRECACIGWDFSADNRRNK